MHHQSAPDAGAAERAAGQRVGRWISASLLLLAAVVCSVYVASNDGGAIAALAKGIGGGQAALEKQLKETREQLAHEASIISSLKAKEGQFQAAFKKAGTSSLAAAMPKGSMVKVKMQQLDGEEGDEPAEPEEGDMSRQKEELEKREDTHFQARQSALVKALTHEAEMKPEDAKWLKWKAAHEEYEQAAFKDISGEEHNRTEAEPEADALWTKYEENAVQLDGTAGYQNLLAEANQTDAQRMKEWDKYLATQRNRTSLFPMVDKTQGVTIDWPADRLKVSKGAATLNAKNTANLHQAQAVSTLRQTLHPGEHVKAVESFLLDKGGVLPMKAGEQATILKINETSGVDTIITTAGKQGLFPESDLVPEASAPESNAPEHAPSMVRASPEEMSVRKVSSHLHLPPAITGNVVDAAVHEGDATFAAQLAKERARSKMTQGAKQAREEDDAFAAQLAKERARSKLMRGEEVEKHEAKEATLSRDKSKSSLVLQREQAEASERAHAAASAKSVVSSAIYEANARFEAAKRAEIARSEAARLQRQKQLAMVRSEHSAAAAHDASMERSVPAADVPHVSIAPAERAQASRAVSGRGEEVSTAVEDAVQAAEATFDKKLKEHEAKVASARSSVEDAKAAGAGKDLSPQLKAAVAAAEAKFDSRVSAAVHHKSAAAVKKSLTVAVPEPAVTQAKAARPLVRRVESPKRAAEERRAHNAVALGLETAQAAYTESMAREEARSLEKKTLENKLKMKELKVQEATATVRALRDALARDEDAGKHMLVAKQLSQQSSYIGDGIGEEETFSTLAKRGEIAHSMQVQRVKAKAASKTSHQHGLKSAKGSSSGSSSSSSNQSPAQAQERSLEAKALEEQAAAGREEQQWQEQQLKSKEMEEEEQAAVRSANTMYKRHMTPLRDVEKTYNNYEDKLQRWLPRPDALSI